MMRLHCPPEACREADELVAEHGHRATQILVDRAIALIRGGGSEEELREMEILISAATSRLNALTIHHDETRSGVDGAAPSLAKLEELITQALCMADSLGQSMAAIALNEALIRVSGMGMAPPFKGG